MEPHLVLNLVTLTLILLAILRRRGDWELSAVVVVVLGTLAINLIRYWKGLRP